MQRQLTCAVADWLNGVTSSPGHSLNERLAALPADVLEGGDVQPLSPVALIADPFRVDKVSDFTERPSSLPAVYVIPDGPTAKEGEAGPVDRKGRNVSIAIRVIVADANRAASLRYADYVALAIEQSIAAFLADDSYGDAARTRGRVRIVSANHILTGPWREAVGEAVAVAVTGLACECRNQAPR